MILEITDAELEVLIKHHREEQYDCANKEEYDDAAYHKERAAGLVKLNTEGSEFLIAAPFEYTLTDQIYIRRRKK